MTEADPDFVGHHPEDGSRLRLQTYADDQVQYLSYHLGNKAYDRATAAGVELDQSEWPWLLAEYDLASRTLTTYPTWLRSNLANFTKPKYRRIRRIAFENQEPITYQKGFELIFDLPTGFLRSPFDGFGLDPRIRFIVEAFEEIGDLKGIVICDDPAISLAGEDVRLPSAVFDEVRLNINRAHLAAVEFANGEKRQYLRHRLLPSIQPSIESEGYFRSHEDFAGLLQSAIRERGTPRTRNHQLRGRGANRTQVGHRSGQEGAGPHPRTGRENSNWSASKC